MAYTGIQQYVSVIMDEMKIQENLVFDKSSGELVGFIDLGDPVTTFANVEQDSDPIASHGLAFQPSTYASIYAPSALPLRKNPSIVWLRD